jgi:cbb3-type cytochrome oxidase subunit 1
MRTLGGGLYLLGGFIMAYNLWRTVTSPTTSKTNVAVPVGAVATLSGGA